jgi:TorA maturation chaperone TorD
MDGGLFFFETEELAREFYSMFEQPLTDSSGLYASIYSPTDGCLTENT